MPSLDQGGPTRRVFTPRPEPPIWRTPEFLRFAAIAGLSLAAIGVVLLVSQQTALPALKDQLALKSADSNQPPLPATASLTPEEKAEREAFLSTFLEGALRDQLNGDEFQETSGYRKLLEQVAQFEPADFTARTMRELDPQVVIADPDAWRGQFVRLRGILGDIVPQKLSRPVAGRRNAWRGQILSGDGFSWATVFEMLDRPFEGQKQSDGSSVTLDDMRMRAVEVEGILYRTGRWNTVRKNDEGQTEELSFVLPWLFVRNMRLIDEGQAPTRVFLNEHPMLILGVLAFVIFGGRLLASWFARRRRAVPKPSKGPTGIRDLFERKLREKGLPPAPPPSPQS